MKMKTKPKKKAPWTSMRGGIKPRTLNYSREITPENMKRGLSFVRKLEKMLESIRRKSRTKTGKRNRVRLVSKARSKRQREYLKVRREFLADVNYCQVCILNGHAHAPTEVHHSRGRAGSLLTDRRFFVAVCRKGHQWIQDNPTKARKLGLLCEAGKWNTPEKESA